MSDVLLFAIGFIVFAVTSTATMWFGYQQFNQIYRRDMAADDQSQVLVRDSDNYEYRVAPKRADSPGLEVIPGGDETTLLG